MMVIISHLFSPISIKLDWKTSEGYNMTQLHNCQFINFIVGTNKYWKSVFKLYCIIFYSLVLVNRTNISNDNHSINPTWLNYVPNNPLTIRIHHSTENNRLESTFHSAIVWKSTVSDSNKLYPPLKISLKWTTSVLKVPTRSSISGWTIRLMFWYINHFDCNQRSLIARNFRWSSR